MSSQRLGLSRLLWGLTGSQIGTTISGAGNSGALGAPSQKPWSPDYQLSLVDLREVTDLALMVAVAGITSAPALTVNVDVYDDQGNLFPAVLTSGAIATATTKLVSGGLHGQSSAYLVLPAWGRVSWTCTGGTCTGVEISLWGR